MKAAAVALFVSVAACGQTVGGGDSGTTDSSTESAVDAGWSTCTSPDHVGICGGSNACAPDSCGCGAPHEPSGLGVCDDPTYKNPLSGNVCHPGYEGRICLSIEDDAGMTLGWLDAEPSLGTLFAQNGGASFVRYADMGLWTGDSIPDAPSCPTMGNVQPCGGSCGTCPPDQTCFGRAPLHPVGVCRPTAGEKDCVANGHICFSGQSCFTYTVQPEAQAVADSMGMCFPDADCTAMAAILPGGGQCTP